MLQLLPHRRLLLCWGWDGLCRPWGLCQIPHELGALLPTTFPTVLFSYRIMEQQNFTALKISPRQQQWRRSSSYLWHSIRCHRQTVQRVTCTWGHRPAHGLAQRCSVQSAGCSHSWSSKSWGEKFILIQMSREAFVLIPLCKQSFPHSLGFVHWVTAVDLHKGWPDPNPHQQLKAGVWRTSRI